MGKDINNKKRKVDEEEEDYEGEEEEMYDDQQENGGDDDDELNVIGEYDDNQEDDQDEDGDDEEKKKNNKKKTQLPKKTKSEKRDEKLAKKSKFDNNASMVYSAKILWEKLKLVKLSPKDRQPLYDQIFEMVKGKMSKIVAKHDASRIVQTLLKFGRKEHRDVIFEELKNDVVTISPNVYGRFMVIKLLKYTTKEQRSSIIQSFYGHICKMTGNREASHVIEYMFAEIATPLQRCAMLEEFYSDEYRLFKSKEVRTLADIFAASPAKKESIIANLGKRLTKVLGVKGELLVTYTFVQRLILQYFEHAAPAHCTDMAETLSEITLPMVHTKDGAMITYYTISYGSAKTRKTIIKSMKDFMVKVASEQHGYLAMLRLLDVTDDTMLINKSVLSELIAQLPELAIHPHGHLWILQILSPYTPQNFTPTVINRLKPDIKSSHNVEFKVSKKDNETRRKELLEFISPKLIDLCSNHLQSLLSTTCGTKVICHTLKECQGNKVILTNRLIDLLSNPGSNNTNDEDEDIEQNIYNTHPENIQILFKNDYIKSTDIPNNIYDKLKDQLIEIAKVAEKSYVMRDLIQYGLSGDTKQSAIKLIQTNSKKLTNNALLKVLQPVKPKEKKVEKK